MNSRISMSCAIAAVALMSAACSVGAPEGRGSEVVVIGLDDNGDYGPLRVRLPVDDMANMANPYFDFEVGTRVEVEARIDDRGLAGFVDTSTGAKPFRPRLIRSGDTYVAQDFETLVALSATHGLFEAREHFERLGVNDGQSFPRKRVIFFPASVSVPAIGGGAPSSDNAFYAGVLGGFVVLRENALEGLPLGVNEGIIAHEFSHAVFERFLAGRLLSLHRGLDEGLADVHGAAVTGDPRFVGASVPVVLADRDMSVLRVYDEGLGQQSLLNDPYYYGAIVASNFWCFRQGLVAEGKLTPAEANQRMAQVAFDAVRTSEPIPLDPSKPAGFEELDREERNFWAAALAAADSTSDRPLFCACTRERFAPIQSSTRFQGVCP